MFDFVWHLRGSVPLDGVGSNTVALDRVERLLERQQKSVSEPVQNILLFDDPIWGDSFGPNWLAMVIYDRGRFWIEQGLDGRRLRYDLRSLHGNVLPTNMIGFWSSATSGAPGRSTRPPESASLSMSGFDGRAGRSGAKGE